jgi:ribosome-binding factor A
VSDRRARLGSAVKEELAKLIPEKVRDPRVAAAGLMTVTRVELTPDGRFARVGISFIGGAGDPAKAIAVLQKSSAYMRGELGRRLAVKHPPELRFLLDRSGEHAARIDALLKGEE